MGVTSVNIPSYYNNNQVINFISILLDKEIFFPGETVTGEVLIQSPGDMYLCNIYLRLTVEEKWTFVESSDSILTDNKLISLHEQGLIEQNKNQVNQVMLSFKANTKFSFRFSFELFKNLHPSFEYPFANRTAFIRYCLSATISGPALYPKANANIIIKSRPLVLFEPLNISSCVNVHTWGVVMHGTTIMSVEFPTNNFRYKDVIPLKVKINNQRGELETKAIKLEISRDMTFFSQGGLQKYTFTKTITKQDYPFVCPMRSTKTETINIQLIDDEENSFVWNTPYPSLKEHMGMFIGSIKTTMIECQYKIKITCYFKGMVGYDNRPRIIAPLSMTYQLNDDFQLEQKENEELKKALFESKIEYDSIKENQKNNLIEGEFNENDFNLLHQGKEIEKEKPVNLIIINDGYQAKKFINNNNQGMNQHPMENNNNNIINPLNQKPSDFVDINAL